ncbi:unnamed protein product [Moneuplotes crassus]|uniref:Uncharacterized protein n=1 Tax=Euplotes crassus TaxID=5936 RepID=A0AAD1XNK8_EUPCR|nr:unnamed protein product [Moneuplotes crassus]CAI2376006.1 unnamed protein product [Moneuplotes crassus]
MLAKSCFEKACRAPVSSQYFSFWMLACKILLRIVISFLARFLYPLEVFK